MLNENWYCKYCDRSVKNKRKEDHCQTNRHKTKARWYKYFRDVGKEHSFLKEKYKVGIYNVDEFNEMRQRMYCEFDRLDNEGYFKEMPDSDYESGEDETKEYERPILRKMNYCKGKSSWMKVEK